MRFHSGTMHEQNFRHNDNMTIFGLSPKFEKTDPY